LTIAKIFADYREKNSGIPSILEGMNVKVIYQNLTIGDYILPGECGVERKNVHDFIHSLTSGRLFNQLLRLKEVYQKPVLIVEGDFQAVVEEFPNPKALWGALASICLNQGIHVFYTLNVKQTAELLITILNQMLKVKGRIEPIIRERRKIRGLTDFQLYVVSSLPGVGLKLADRMLKKFKTVRAVFSASKKDLMFIEGFSERKAEKICKLLDLPYNPLKQDLAKQKILEES